MPLKRFDLHVPISEDGRTTFAELGDILDHLATLYAWHPDAYGFLVTRASEARQVDSVYEREEGALTLRLAQEHRRAHPRGCPVPDCAACWPWR